MSEVTEALEARAMELATDVNAAWKDDPDSVDYALLEKAVAHITTGALLLKATTPAFKQQMRPQC